MHSDGNDPPQQCGQHPRAPHNFVITTFSTLSFHTIFLNKLNKDFAFIIVFENTLTMDTRH